MSFRDEVIFYLVLIALLNLSVPMAAGASWSKIQPAEQGSSDLNATNADKLDGIHSSGLTWNLLGISQTDVSKTDVGLGNVLNINQSTMAGNQIEWNSTTQDYDVLEGSGGGLNADEIDSIDSGSLCQSDGTNCPSNTESTDNQTIGEALSEGNNASSLAIVNLGNSSQSQAAVTYSQLQDYVKSNKADGDADATNERQGISADNDQIKIYQTTSESTQVDTASITDDNTQLDDQNAEDSLNLNGHNLTSNQEICVGDLCQT